MVSFIPVVRKRYSTAALTCELVFTAGHTYARID
jgi:hypothetical protein